MDDKDILDRFQDPETREPAFKDLILKYQKRLYWHIRRMVIDHDDTDDILQDVFIKIWKNLHKFREDSQLFTWIYRIATNECITFLNRKSREFGSNLVSIEDAGHLLSEKLQENIHLSGDQIQLKLQQAILSLPEKQRLVFNMKYYEDIKYEEMAEILHTSVGALKASYHHAVKKIEKYLGEH